MDVAIKTRIIKHMNESHQDSLIRYLEHFCDVSSFSARNARLEDVTLLNLKIISGGKSYDVPIEPPMTDWSEVRPRVIAMDVEAVTGLGRSSITVKRYVQPYGFMLMIFAAALSTFITFSRRENFEPGSVLYDSILRFVPRFAHFCWRIRPFVLYPMILLHGGEATYMARTRLLKHNVPVGTRLWLVWICSTFIEGYGSFVRFDGLVKDQRAEKEKAAHQA